MDQNSNRKSATNKELLVTSALPYASGDLHLGHILEHIQSDIWVRWQRQQGNSCYYVCGSDAHGTPIMLQAQKRGIEPSEMVAQYRISHMADLAAFGVIYDNFYTTHCDENAQLAAEIYNKLYANGDITVRTIAQAFDPVQNIFLPDRYVKGDCPKCGVADQYGDSCEHCGAHYTPLELKNPKSVLSGATPIEKTSEHYFFDLPKYQDFLQAWTTSGTVQPEIANKLQEWFSAGLAAWDISRDAPYFGFKIPGTADKYFYVWLDAPIGYISSFKNLASRSVGLDFKHYWQANATTELYHFIGKDIIYFHALFWPAMLHGSGFRTPTKIFTHGFLTINGEKMSKSRGTFISAQQYLAQLPAEYLRYYFAAKLSDTVDDLDLNFQDFGLRINADLVGKLVNIASRCAAILNNNFAAKLAPECCDLPLYQHFVAQTHEIGEYYKNLQYAKAMRAIMCLADEANKFIDLQKPWALIKVLASKPQAWQVCSLGINLFRVLITYLAPVLPQMASQAAEFLNITELNLNELSQPLLDHQLNIFKPLATRLDLNKVNIMQQQPQAVVPADITAASQPIAATSALALDPLAATISFEDFAKVDLRIVKILHAESIPEADKLIKLTVDLGGETRQIFAGIKATYDPADLVGKLTVIVANLAPRKMRFGVSEGMLVIAGGAGKSGLWLLEPALGAEPGMRVK